MNKKRFLIFSFLCLGFYLYSQSFGGEYVSRAWTAADGLPGNTINDIIQDKQGYMYIGTYGGLVRFDGVEFSVMNKNTVKNLGIVSARCVFEDDSGALWIGSNDEGVAKISKNQVSIINVENGLPNNSVRDITQDKAGNIWIGTSSGVVFVTPEGEIKKPAGLENFGEENILTVVLYCDTAGRIWLSGQNNNSVYYYVAGKFQKFTDLDRFENISVTSISQDDTGAFWFGLNKGSVLKYEDADFKVFDSSNSPLKTYVNHIYQDSSNTIWISTENGVVVYKNGEFSTYTEDDGLTNNNVKCILEDREGNIWIATDRGGIEKMSVGKFRTVRLNSSVNCFAEDATGRVWVGTDTGLLCYKKLQPIKNDITELCKNIRIRHLEIADNGDLLISTYKDYGQIRAGKNGIKYWNMSHGLSGDRVRVCIEDKYGNLYIGTTTGLNFLDGKTGKLKVFTKEDGLTNDYIMCLLEDSNGAIWIGTDGGGVNLLEDGKITKHFTSENGLIGNVIFKITEEKDTGALWICTGSGISRMDRTNSGEPCFFNYNTSNGMGTDSVFQMLYDYTGTVWMTSNRGISSVSQEEMLRLRSGSLDFIDPKFYNKNDGLQSEGITSTSLSICDSLGRIWFTLIDGFAIYDPVKVKSNPVRPLVHIENVKIDDRIVFPQENENIIIPAGTKRVDIKYTGLSYTSPELVRFKYMLEGFDKKYSAFTPNRSVSYTNLKPGSYTFNLVAANGDGLMSEETEVIKIKQKPFYYQTTIFWVIIVFGLTYLTYAFVRYREKRYQNEQKRLEEMVNIKTIDLERERDNSDRLLLNILPTPIAQRLKENDKDTIADKFSSVSILFADIVGFTKISANREPGEIVSALNNLFSRFDNRAIESNIEKIKTIGDCYMAVCGLPFENKDHATTLIKYACGMFSDLEQFNKETGMEVQMRIGISSGEVVAGVIGKSKFIYDLWGDAVNVASRMQATGTAGLIHVSSSTRKLTSPLIEFSEEEEIMVKGKGTMKASYVKNAREFVFDIDKKVDGNDGQKKYI